MSTKFFIFIINRKNYQAYRLVKFAINCVTGFACFKRLQKIIFTFQKRCLKSQFYCHQIVTKHVQKPPKIY